MKEEKMMILSMLEEGKITSEEAIKLLEALEEIDIPRDANNFANENSQKNTNQEKDPILNLNSLDDLGSDIRDAVSKIDVREVKSDINIALSNVLSGLRNIGNSFASKSTYETITTKLDLDLNDIENPSLELHAINDSIRLRPTDEDKLLIKVTCQYKNGVFSPNDSYFTFIADGDKISFMPKYHSNISIKLDVLMPEKHYNEILLNSTNGKIDIRELNVDTLRCITTNSSIDVVDVSSKEIDVTTKNGRIECRDINSDIINATTTNSNIFINDTHCTEIDAKTANAKIAINDIDAGKITCKNSNASIEANDITCDTIHLITSNGKITCDEIDMDRIKEIKLITSNGSISSEIYDANKESYFDLETSMGSIILDVPNLIYKTNKQANLGLKKIEAHSANYDDNIDHLKFFASTSNGSIKIYQE